MQNYDIPPWYATFGDPTLRRMLIKMSKLLKKSEKYRLITPILNEI